MKNIGLGKVVIQNRDHLEIKTISVSPWGDLNSEVPLYKQNSEDKGKIESSGLPECTYLNINRIGIRF